MGFGCDVCSLPMCCGFMEAGAFREGQKWAGSDQYAETPEGLVKNILAHADGRPVIFNFVKQAMVDEYDDEPTGEFHDYYDCAPLRDYVKNFKGVIDLGKHINPGTNNKIHSLVIKDY